LLPRAKRNHNPAFQKLLLDLANSKKAKRENNKANISALPTTLATTSVWIGRTKNKIGNKYASFSFLEKFF